MKLKFALLAALVAASLSVAASGHDMARALNRPTDAQISQMRGFVNREVGPQRDRDRTSPIGYGFVNYDGTKGSGSSNVTTMYNATNQWYEIKFSHVNYYFSHFATTVTYTSPTGTGIECRSDSSGGKLLVICFDLTGTMTQASFGFITF